MCPILTFLGAPPSPLGIVVLQSHHNLHNTTDRPPSQQKSGQEGATHLPGGLSTLVDIQLCTTDHQANKSLEQGATHLRAAFQHWLIFYSAGMSLSGGFAYQRQNDG